MSVAAVMIVIMPLDVRSNNIFAILTERELTFYRYAFYPLIESLLCLNLHLAR